MVEKSSIDIVMAVINPKNGPKKGANDKKPENIPQVKNSFVPIK